MSTEQNAAEEPSSLVMNIGNIIIGSAILTAVYLLSPVPLLELAQWAAFTLLPVLAIGFGLGLISMGTIKLVWNQELFTKVNDYVEKERIKRVRRGRVLTKDAVEEAAATA